MTLHLEKPAVTPWDTLTKREMEVATRYAAGLERKEIAAELGCTPKTVDTHRMKAMTKIGVRNNVELSQSAIRHGVMSCRNDRLRDALDRMPNGVSTTSRGFGDMFQRIIEAAVGLISYEEIVVDKVQGVDCEVCEDAKPDDLAHKHVLTERVNAPIVPYDTILDRPAAHVKFTGVPVTEPEVNPNQE